MPLSNSLLSYVDCQQALEKAMASDLGVVVQFTESGKAYSFSQRCNKFKQIFRKTTMENLPKDDPNYGTSPYDSIRVMMKTKKAGEYWVVELRKRETLEYQIRDIKE